MNTYMRGPAPDAVVVGGGVIGLAVAWRAAESGLAVTVVDGSPGRGASWAAAGLLAPVTEVHHGEERVLALGVESLRRYPGFVAALEELTGMSVGYRRMGTLIVAPDADSFASLSELRRLQDRLRLSVSPLSTSEARSLEPALTPRLRGAWFVDGDHSVDNRALVDALGQACRMRGVQFVEGHVGSVIADDDGARGVALRDGTEITSARVVLAAGCWSAGIDGPSDAMPPVRPVKGQLLYLRGPAGEPLVQRAIRGPKVYIVPRGDGRYVVGATVEERGFDTTVTAGAVYELLRSGYELVPGLAEFELLECVAGLRPGSPDNAPFIGQSGVANLLVATGHYRNGILLTPLTADGIAELLVSGRTPPELEPASPNRLRRARALR